jgi:hypothetical protein
MKAIQTKKALLGVALKMPLLLCMGLVPLIMLYQGMWDGGSASLCVLAVAYFLWQKGDRILKENMNGRHDEKPL